VNQTYRIRIDDFIAALFSLANDGGDAAQDAFTLGVCAFLWVAVEDFGRGDEARFANVCDSGG
jgi:hypothetical protein